MNKHRSVGGVVYDFTVSRVEARPPVSGRLESVTRLESIRVTIQKMTRLDLSRYKNDLGSTRDFTITTRTRVATGTTC